MSYYFLKTVLKKLFAAAAALAASAPAAFAGPYLNWETNLSYTGSDYTSALHELHIGWEGENGAATYYAVSESVSVYGELSLVTAKENGYGAKGGIKYSF